MQESLSIVESELPTAAAEAMEHESTALKPIAKALSSCEQ